MTDYSGLVNDLREYLTIRQISDLLEAQAKEIKIYQQTELTYVTRVADLHREYSEMQAKLKARVAELEAALKPFEKYQTEYPDEYSKHPIIGAFLNELRAACAALKGEK